MVGEKLLSIGAVAKRTGMTVSALRAWETRHGFPTPVQSAGSHRRYSEDDIEAIERVLAARRSGYSLEAAIAATVGGAAARSTPPSIYAAVREGWPSVAPRTIDRRTMLAISRAIEDECCARADNPLLVAAFQTSDAYAPARRRWRELARTASGSVVLAAFGRSRQSAPGPIEVDVDERAPVLREWAVICDAPRSSACLVGWEQPAPTRHARPSFEALWSVDPAVVRTASRAALALATEHAPGLELPPTPPPLDALAARDDRRVAIDPERLVALTNRVVAQLDAALRRR